jgi:hypothetical protein
MQSEQIVESRGCCLKKLQTHNADSRNDAQCAAVNPPHDVEKGEVNPPSSPTSGPQTLSDLARPPLFSNVSFVGRADEEKDDFPEGGVRAWSVVLGAFCGTFCVFGIINSTAILLDYFSANQLKGESPSQIGWIFGLALFLTFFW